MYRDFARSNGQSVRHEVREGVVATCRCVDGAKKKNFNLISQEHIMSRDIPNHSHTAVQELLAVEPDGY